MILLFARHYPPAVSGGARRPWMMAQALRRLGHSVFVVAPTLPDGEFGLAVEHPHRDPPETNAGAPLDRRPRETLRDFAREWLLWPDPDIRWSRRARDAAVKELARIKFTPDWVLTSSPPESLHAIGKATAKRYGAVWIADFRDHWFERAFRLERRKPLRRMIEQRYARHLLRGLDGFSAVNARIRNEIADLAPASAASVVAAHMAPPPVAPEPLPRSEIHAVHTGSFSLSDPDCRISDLLAVFDTAAAANPRLRLHLVGRLSTEEHAAVDAASSYAQIKRHGVLPLPRALAFQAAADALVVVSAANAPVPPGKYAEYRRYRAPIISISASNWEAGADFAGSDVDADPADRLSAVTKLSTPSSVEQTDIWAEIVEWGRLFEALAARQAALKGQPGIG